MPSTDSDLFTAFPYVSALAYVDSFGGLVPCRVEYVEPDGRIAVRITADRAGYRKGEVCTFVRTSVVDRRKVHVVGGQYRIRP